MKNFILFFLMALIVNSCGDTNNITSPDETHIVKGSIKGVILNSTTNEPVVGAFITTLPLTSTTKSKEDGTFLLASVGPEVYNIVISHPDYQTFNEKIRVSDQITNDIEFNLVSLESLNTPPDEPIIFFPKNNSKIGTFNISFSWSATDKNKDSLEYDVYFGIENDELTKIAENITDNLLTYQYNFKENINYQWYVVSKDKYSETVSEKVTFTYKEIIITNIPGLLGLWKLNNDAFDYGPNSYNGIEEGMQYIDDRSGTPNSAAYFDGTGFKKSNIVLPTGLQLSYKFTISMWIKPDPSLGQNGSVGNFECISKWGGSGEGRASWAFGINKDANIFLATYNNNSNVQSAKGSKIVVGKWQHIAATFDNGNVIFYLNGISIGEATGMQIPQVSILNASIGARPDFLSSYHGAIDDVYLFDRLLTNAEILKLSQE